MLYIVTNTGARKREYQWHIGYDSPLKAVPEAVATVVEVQADCDELEYIQREFAGLPQALNVRVVRWFGDHAKFIAANLRK